MNTNTIKNNVFKSYNVKMVGEDDKYRAEVYKVAGFALMTPFGRLVLNLLDSGFTFTRLFLINSSVSLILLILGARMIDIGFKFLTEEYIDD